MQKVVGFFSKPENLFVLTLLIGLFTGTYKVVSKASNHNNSLYQRVSSPICFYLRLFGYVYTLPWIGSLLISGGNYEEWLQASKNTEPYRFFIIGLVMIFGSYAMYIPVLLERIARGIMNKVSIKNDLELINSKFGTSYTASDYMYGKGHIKQIVTYISIGEESIAELISNPKLSDAKRTVILDLLSRGLTVDQIKPYIQSDDTRWLMARDEMFVNERFLEKVLQVMGRMRFGVKNSMLIALQNEKATRIATAASWRGLGVQLLPGAEAKPIWLDAGADTQRKTIVPSKWYDITQTDAGEKLTLKGTIYNTLAICRITLNQIDELKIVEQQGVTGIHYDREVHAYLVQPGQMERAMLCYAALEALAEKDFALVFQENEKTALPDTPANEIIAKCAAYIVCVHFGVLPQEVCVRVPTALGTDKIENLLRALSTAQSIAAQEIMVIENRLRSKKWRTI